MKNHGFVLTLAGVLLAVAVSMGMLIGVQAHKPGGPTQGGTQVGDYRPFGPTRTRISQSFFVHGKNVIKVKSLLTLEEAPFKGKSLFSRGRA